MARTQETKVKVEEWNEWIIYVDGKGIFFVQDDHNNRAEAAETLDALKAKLSKPTKVDPPVKGLTAPNWTWREDAELVEVDIYGVSGLGSILFQRKDEKARTRQGDVIYLFDAERMAERQRLLKQQEEFREALKRLMDKWPRATSKSLLERKVNDGS